jgi:hypothetical protein
VTCQRLGLKGIENSTPQDDGFAAARCSLMRYLTTT